MLANPRLTGARSTHVLLSVAALLALVALLPGCSGKSTRTMAPAGVFSTESPFSGGTDRPAPVGGVGGSLAGGATSYPLAVGNRWDYALHFRVVTIPDQGEPTATLSQSLWTAAIAGTAFSAGVEYFVQEEGDPRQQTVSLASFVRQDADGYYMVDHSPVFSPAGGSAPAADPLAVSRATLARHTQTLAGTAHAAAFARAAAAVTEKLERMRQSVDAGAWATTEALPNELTLLQYPLRVGSEWVVRGSPRFGRIVVGLEDLMLPAGRVRAWRLRGVSELYGPRDEVWFWYGRAGLLRVHYRGEMDAVDDSGNPIGRAIAVYDQSLVRFTRAGPLASNGVAR